MAVGGTGKGIGIIVGVEYDGRDLRTAQRELDGLKRKHQAAMGPMGKMAAGLKSQLTPNFMAMGAAVAAAGAALAAFAIKLGVDAVQAAAAEEQAVARLSTALENVGQSFRLAEAEAFVDSLQRSSGVADDDLRPALQSLVTATGNLTQAQDLLGIALDISAATGKDLTSVAAALGKAANGQFTQINKLTNGALNPSILATKDLALITAELSRLFGGQAEANADTFAGAMSRLKIAADELLESFGEGFIGAFSDAGGAATDIGASLKAAEPAMHDFGKAVGDLAKIFMVIGPFLDEFVAAFKYAIPAALAAAAAAFPPIAPLIAAVLQILGAVDGAIEDVADQAQIVGVKFSGPMSDGARQAQERMGGLSGSIEDTEEALNQLNDEMNEFFGFLNQRDAVRGYEQAVDDLRKSLRENGKSFDEGTKAGRANQEALDGIYDSAIKVAEGQATAAEKVKTLEEASAEAKRQLDKTNMSEEAKQRLLQPFDDAIAKFKESKTEVSNLKQEMERLPTNIPITIDVKTQYVGTPPPGGFPPSTTNGSAYGGFVGGHGGTRADDVPAMLSSGEFVIQAPAVSKFGRGLFAALNQGVNPLAGMTPSVGGSGGGGVSIGSINVTAAPGERAETSLPRALRRAAFLAGVNG